MKKIVFIFITQIFLVACGSLRTVTVDRLQMGMTREEVENILGRPEKKLVASLTEFGYQEILAYKIGYDVYALEFMNDQLVRYEFLREDLVFVPRPPLPPVVIVHDEHPPVHQKPVERPPSTKPSPSPTPPPTRPPQENSREERPGRTPGSEKAEQARPNETSRPATTETTRPGRRNSD